MTGASAPSRWSATGILLHWIVAAAILGSLALGWWMTHRVPEAARRFDLTQLHKSTGIAVGLLLVLRLVWRLGATAPASVDTGWRRAAARATHVALHVLPLAMIASGWVSVSASPIPLPATLLGWSLPAIVAPDMALYEQAKTAHEIVSKLLAATVALHVGAALWHTLALRDGLLTRMSLGRASKA
jgi:cytochrome b561